MKKADDLSIIGFSYFVGAQKRTRTSTVLPASTCLLRRSEIMPRTSHAVNSEIAKMFKNELHRRMAASPHIPPRISRRPTHVFRADHVDQMA